MRLITTQLMNITLENYLEMFQKVLAVLSSRASETVFFPVISAYKAMFDANVYLLIEMTKDRSPENLKEALHLASIGDGFLRAKLDPSMKIFKEANSHLYKEYCQARKITKRRTAAPNYEGLASHGFTQVGNIPYLSSRSFLFKNAGTVPLTFALSHTFKTQKGKELVLRPSESAMRSAGILNADPKANKIYVINDNQGVDGKYQIWIT